MICNTLDLIKNSNERNERSAREPQSNEITYTKKKMKKKTKRDEIKLKQKTEQMVNIVIMVQIETLSFGHLGSVI